MPGREERCTARVTPWGVTLHTNLPLGRRCAASAMSGIHCQPLCEEHHQALKAHLRVLQRIRAIPDRPVDPDAS